MEIERASDPRIQIVILVCGVLATLAALIAVWPEAQKRGRVGKLALFSLPVLQLVIVGSLYYDIRVLTRRLKLARERNLAVTLAAYTSKVPGFAEFYGADNPYYAGYYSFRRGKEGDSGAVVEAKKYFERCVHDDVFVAPAKYLLAHIYHTGQIVHDLKVPIQLCKEAIDYDDEYAAPYYELAVLQAMSNDPTEAISNLEASLRKGPIQCFDINRDGEFNQVWQPYMADPVLRGKFDKLKEDCRGFADNSTHFDAIPFDAGVLTAKGVALAPDGGGQQR